MRRLLRAPRASRYLTPALAADVSDQATRRAFPRFIAGRSYTSFSRVGRWIRCISRSGSWAKLRGSVGRDQEPALWAPRSSHICWHQVREGAAAVRRQERHGGTEHRSGDPGAAGSKERSGVGLEQFSRQLRCAQNGRQVESSRHDAQTPAEKRPVMTCLPVSAM